MWLLTLIMDYYGRHHDREMLRNSFDEKSDQKELWKLGIMKIGKYESYDHHKEIKVETYITLTK